MQDDERKRQWSGLFLVLGGLAVLTAFEAALARNYIMVVFLAAAGSLLLVTGWITRKRTGRRPLTSQFKTK
jgi:drug/metabolite transporter (DMT)-like permease